MKKLDIAVVGSGIGGSLIAALQKDKNIVLFEKDMNLGGCASTFKKYGNYYNAGATTFVGYEDNHPIKEIFEEIGFTPDIEESKIAIQVLQKTKVLNRVRDFDSFLEELEKIYPNKNNRLFWTKIKQIDENFWKIKDVYFAKHSISSYMKSFCSFKDLFSNIGFDLFKSASYFIKQTLGNISKEYMDFIDAQLLITVQSKAKNVSLLQMALGLSYPFHKVFYAKGGMGKLIEDILSEVEVHNKEEILSIEKLENSYKLVSKKAEYEAKNVILNSSIYDCARLFTNKSIKRYYEKFSFSDQSAFVVYLTIDSSYEFLEHYQIILENEILNSISNSFFVSFSKKDDEVLSKNGYSVTISTHTKALFWKDLTKEEYKLKKEQTQELILKEFLAYFDMINEENIKKCFSATPKTFKRYIGRLNCGGSPVNIDTVLSIPSCKTPFKGLYNVGDTIFAGQGWPGVALGVKVLNKELNEKL